MRLTCEGRKKKREIGVDGGGGKEVRGWRWRGKGQEKGEWRSNGEGERVRGRGKWVSGEGSGG